MNRHIFHAFLAGGVPALTLIGLLAFASCANAPTLEACGVDVAGKVVLPVATSADPAALKALNAGVTAAAVVAVDPACQDALKAVNADLAAKLAPKAP